MHGLNKYLIDLNIETLAGTTFTIKASLLESIQSLKAKIQRHEGVPISHQHLVWQSIELEDNCCLNDYNIPNGATIRMVLALRGGPINTRRMTTEDTLLHDVSDLMEIQEDSNLWGNNNDPSHSMNKHVTLLLFRDGDHLNLLRVIDRGETTSPISGAMSAASMYVPFDETDHETILNNLEEIGQSNGGSKLELNTSNKSSKLSKLLSSSSSSKKNSKSTHQSSATKENQKTKEKMNEIRKRLKETKRMHLLKEINNNIDIKNNENSLNSDKSNVDINNNHQNNLNENLVIINKTNQPSAPPPPPPLQPSHPPPNNKSINGKSFRVKRYHLIAGDTRKLTIGQAKLVQPKLKNTSETTPATGDNSGVGAAAAASAAEDEYEYEYYEDEEDEDYDDEDEDEDEDDEDEEDDDEEECVDTDEDIDEEEDDEYDEEEESDVEESEDEEEESEEVEYGVDDVEYGCYDEDDEEDEDEDDDVVVVVDDEYNFSLGVKNNLLKHKENQNESNNNISNSEIENKDNNKNQENMTPTYMMMRLNSDQLSLNHGPSSSLATTALPTILTPMYVTDGENNNPASSSKQRNSANRVKYIRNKNNKNVVKLINGEYVITTTSKPKKLNKNKHNNSEQNVNNSIDNSTTPNANVKQIKPPRRRRKNINNSNTENNVQPSNEEAVSNNNSTNKIKKSKTPNSKRLLKQQLKENQYKALLIKDGNYIMAARQLSQYDDINENDTENDVNTNNNYNNNNQSINPNTNSLLQMQQKRLTKMLQSTLNIYNNLPVLPKVVSSSTNSNQTATEQAENNTTSTPPKPAVRSSLSSSNNKEPTFLGSQKRVSFTVDQSNEQQLMDQNLTSLDSSRKLSSNIQQQQPIPLGPQLKPLIISKQKPLPKLGSLYATQEMLNSSNQHQSINNEDNQQNQVRKSSISINNQTSLITPNPTPATSATNNNTSILPALNRLDLFKNSSILPSYHNATISNMNSNSNSLNQSNFHTADLDTAPGTSIEITRLYSASKMSKSISTNDLSSNSKSFKLPPVVQTNNNSNNLNNNGTTNSTILIGGSNNNLNSIGLTNDNNTNVSSKKKMTDLSRYCYFCHRKTGLASSYICRCGNNYCTQHRNAEAHNCTYDYKTEGRKLIEHSNPLVAAPKLPKI